MSILVYQVEGDEGRLHYKINGEDFPPVPINSPRAVALLKLNDSSGGAAVEPREETALPTNEVSKAELLLARRHLLEKPSTSYIQRMMNIGYNRAACIMDILENEGFVSKPDNNGKRHVLSAHSSAP